MAYRIVGACTGELERGRLSVDAMLERQPWPVSEHTSARALGAQ